MRPIHLAAAMIASAMAVMPAWAQDSCDSAMPIALGTDVEGTTMGASASILEGAGCTAGDTGPAAEDHWYVFTPAATDRYTVELCGSAFDTSLSLFEGGCPPSTPRFACNDDGCHTQSRINETLQAGTPYYIRIAGWDGHAGEYRLRVIPTPSAPPNDFCEAASIAPLNTMIVGHTYAAGTDDFGSCANSSRDAWHLFTPPVTAPYHFSLCGSEFDTVLTIFDAPCYEGQELACDDDGDCGVDDRVSQVTVDLTQGQSYLIRVASWSLSGGGRYELRVTSTAVPPCPCERDEAVGIDVFDLLAYLDLWFAGDQSAELDGAAGVDVFDLLFFLDCWFPASAGAACP